MEACDKLGDLGGEGIGVGRVDVFEAAVGDKDDGDDVLAKGRGLAPLDFGLGSGAFFCIGPVHVEVFGVDAVGLVVAKGFLLNRARLEMGFPVVEGWVDVACGGVLAGREEASKYAYRQGGQEVFYCLANLPVHVWSCRLRSNNE